MLDIPPKHLRAISVCLLNLSLHLAAATSPYAWIRTNVHFALLMLVSYELERRDLQVAGSRPFTSGPWVYTLDFNIIMYSSLPFSASFPLVLASTLYDHHSLAP